MANVNMTKASMEALDSIMDMIQYEEEKSNMTSIGLFNVDGTRCVCFNTNTWDADSIVELVNVYIEYLIGNMTWRDMVTYDDSASVSKLQFAHDRGCLEKQLRTYAKSEISKSQIENHELARKIDLISVLIENHLDIDLIRENLIKKYSDNIDFFKRYESIDLEKVIGKTVQQVDDDNIITNRNLKEIDKFVARLEKAKKQMARV